MGKYFKLEKITDTNDISTASTGLIVDLKTEINSFLDTLVDNEDILKRMSENSEYDMIFDIENSINVMRKEFYVLKSKIQQINFK